jgi:hypothetical protein
MTTYQEAIDAMIGAFYAVWSPRAAIYQDVPPDAAAIAASDDTNAAPVPWARVSTAITAGWQATMGDVGNRRFDTEGILTIEIYTPRGDGLTSARILHRLVEQAFQGVSTLNGVWFRNVRTVPAQPSGPWSHANVIIEFLYDEVR